MAHIPADIPADEETRRRLYVYNGGFLTQTRVRRILELSGWDIQLGAPNPGDWVGVWGKSPTSPRGEAVADWRGAQVLRIEDAFLRSVHPGRVAGEPPLGLLIDDMGVHFDSSTPSRLEHILATHLLDDTALLNRARDCDEWLRVARLNKYSGFDPDRRPPNAPYVLVIDQTRDDASIKYGGGSAALFQEMLVFAQEENPGARIVIKTHPETAHGARQGHFTPADERGHIMLLTDPVCPYGLMEGATAVYTVSSQMGFEAIMAGHKPRVFGQPFYAGWGLTQDENPVARRERRLTRAQLFAAAMILAPTWYDASRDRLCDLETAIAQFEATTRAWREDRKGYVATGMRLWKRGHLQRQFGHTVPLRFARQPAKAAALAQDTDRALMIWAGAESRDEGGALPRDLPTVRVEDGFLRSRGLGAELTPPLSLVCDGRGIYYDPTRASDLESLIAARAELPDFARHRAEALIQKLIRARLSKYNLDRRRPDLPDGHRILVPGQVEDDASIRFGAPKGANNLTLLERTRAENPDAKILYKPHPDVEAGLRPGAISRAMALQYADAVLEDADPICMIEDIDEVWTLTSLLGFEALIRGKPVTCLGTPFYAGWGLTNDLGPVPARRQARPDLAGLVYAALIDYPRYFDPVIGAAAPVEAILYRLANDDLPAPGPGLRWLSKLQGLLAGYAGLWR